jgi:RNA polymerase sigma-70 factor (ECF subfamily)
MSAVRYGEEQRFPTTRWSLVDLIRQRDADGRREALGQLLACYLSAMQTHLVRVKGLKPDDAEELVQEFIASKILQRNLIAQANRELGKFRTFLLTALDRFLIDWYRQQGAKKRSPGDGYTLSASGEAEYTQAGPTPSDIFDAAWARDVLAEALRRMRCHCETSKRTDIWGVFEARVAAPTLKGTAPVGFRELVERFGLRSPAQTSNVLITGKRMYARVLRSVVAEYTQNVEEVEAEIAELREVLAQAGR